MLFLWWICFDLVSKQYYIQSYLARRLKLVAEILTSQKSVAVAGIEPTVPYEEPSE